MNNLSSYCGLGNAKIRASDKDLPVKPWMHLTVDLEREILGRTLTGCGVKTYSYGMLCNQKPQYICWV